MKKITNSKENKPANLDYYCSVCGQPVKKEDIATHKCKQNPAQ